MFSDVDVSLVLPKKGRKKKHPGLRDSALLSLHGTSSHSSNRLFFYLLSWRSEWSCVWVQLHTLPSSPVCQAIHLNSDTHNLKSVAGGARHSHSMVFIVWTFSSQRAAFIFFIYLFISVPAACSSPADAERFTVWPQYHQQPEGETPLQRSLLRRGEVAATAA